MSQGLDLPKPDTLDRMNEAVIGRFVVSLCVLAIIAVCLIAGNYMQSTVNQLRSTHQTFNDRQLRNGYVAMSDVQRLVLILQEAVSEGQMTPEAITAFRSGADFLYVRTDNFRRVLKGDMAIDSAAAAIAELEKIQDVVDSALRTDFSDLNALSSRLTGMSQDARQALVAYLDDMRRLQDRLLLKQSLAVENQRKVLWGSLAGLSLFGITAVVLLRREVLARKARRLAEERVRHLAFFDPMTGLPNRVHFQHRLSTALEEEPAVALLLVDLDGFKLINDTYGHAAGDAILKHVSAMLSDVSRSHGGFSARLGGDEFAVILQTDHLQTLQKICTRIGSLVAEPITFEGESLQVDASIGLATTTQIGDQIDMDIDSLSRVADFALYASKSNGKKRFTIYDEDLEEQFLNRRAMVEELPRAIKDGSIGFFLQPKVNLATEQTYGFEALVRWERNGIIVPPADFIATAEESGMITDIDFCVLRAACFYMADFNRRHGTCFTIAVNCSTLHFTSQRFVGVVREALRASGLPPELLTIEITETVEMQDWDQAKTIIAAIHGFGAKVSIDDFGVGFSSLAYLRTTVADEIKIDRSLVQDIETSDRSRFLLDAVIDIARNLELDVVVEGIETREQLDLVLAMGANRAQGFLFGRPLPKDEALAKAMTEPFHEPQKSAS